MGCEARRPPGALSRCREVPRCVVPFNERARGTRHGLAEARPLALQPSLELARPRDEEPVQEIALVALERRAQLTRRNGLIKRHDVAPQPREVEADLLVPAGDEDVAAKRHPQDVQRLPQCRPRVFLVELRPEQGEQAVTAVESSGSGGGEVGEQRETVRSREQSLDLMSRCIGEMQSPEHPELDHTTLLSVTASGDATVTTW